MVWCRWGCETAAASGAACRRGGFPAAARASRAARGAGARQRIRPASIRRPSLPRTAGSKVSVAARTATTESMMPSAMLRNAGLGTIRTVVRATRTVSPLNATAFPAVPIVSAIASMDALTRSGFSARACKAARKRTTMNKRVVDAQREREHHREVQRPDAHRGDVRGEHERACCGQQADEREHQRKAGGDQAAESDDEHDHRHGPRQNLGFDHRRVVDLVEVRPQRAGAGELAPTRSSVDRLVHAASRGRRPHEPSRWRSPWRRPG